ncbi:MAG: tRNA (cytidine(34)-2'-O)-methyltransferase [Microthrixaceae bacterium]
MLNLVLVAPQIAANTGNIIRLCANVGARLHLVRPLGFTLDSAAVRRSGLDYHELTDTQIWDSFEDCKTGIGQNHKWFATTTEPPHLRYDQVEYQDSQVVVFGCEATGLGEPILQEFPAEQRLHIPMRPANRSLNLANAVSVVAYEAWRQQEFSGSSTGTFQESLRTPQS